MARQIGKRWGAGRCRRADNTGRFALNATINFKAAFACTKQIFLWVKNNENVTNDWQDMGTWTVQGSPPSLSIAKSHAGNFTQGQQNATYAVSVSNASML